MVHSILSFLGMAVGVVTSTRQSVQKLVVLSSFMVSAFVVSALPVSAQDVVTAVTTQATVQKPMITAPITGQSFASPLPMIMGKAYDTAEVLVFIDGKLNGTTPVADGVFSYTPFLPLASGEHQLHVRAKGAMGDMSMYSETIRFTIVPNPSPTLTNPKREEKLGQDRAWVGGVAANDSLIRVLVDGTEYARTQVKNDASGVGSFGVNLPGLPLGNHVVTAIARDAQGKESFASNARIITIVPPTPSPILNKPLVNADAGIERPFITGLVKNNLSVSIVMNGVVQETLTPEAHASGVTSFSWQPKERLALGTYTFEAFASDNGKLSNNSTKQVWQVGDPEVIAQLEGGTRLKVDDKKEDAMAMQEKPLAVQTPEEPPVDGVGGPDPDVMEEPEKPLSVATPEEPAKPLTVKDTLEVKESETPLVQDTQTSGRVVADDDDTSPLLAVNDVQNNGSALSTEDSDDAMTMEEPDEDDAIEVAPNAVRRVSERETQDADFTFNTSLIIGIVILVFLLLSILVWYIQEKKEALGTKVVDIFKENADQAVDQSSNVTSEPEKIVVEPHTKKNTKDPLKAGKDAKSIDKNDLPPPPPPMF